MRTIKEIFVDNESGNVQWLVEKWHQNKDCDYRTISDDEIRAMFSKARGDVVTTPVKRGRIVVHTCPRCGGTGRWVDGKPCYRCYGSSPKRAERIED